MDFSSLLTQGLFSQTDPTRLHAELWADYVSKVMTTWLPMLMATVLVGRDFFGPGIKCFPMDLTDTPSDRNGTSACTDNTSFAPKPAVLREISDYSRQLAEYVDIYCAKQDHYKSSTMFNYQLFTMMLVIQAALLYAPVLLWNIKPARKILCHLRFLIHDIEHIYQHGHHKRHNTSSTDTNDKPDMFRNIGNWENSRTLYKFYMLKQFASVVLSVIFIIVYFRISSLTFSNIHDEYFCSVKEKFMVNCAVSSAMVHECMWITNLLMLCLNVFSIIIHIITILCDCYHGPESQRPFKKLDITVNEPPNDAHLIYTFLRANIESIEKYNYMYERDLDEVTSVSTLDSLSNPPSTSSTAPKNLTNTSGAAPNPVNASSTAPNKTNTSGAAPNITSTSGAVPNNLTNTSGAAPTPPSTSGAARVRETTL